jgi:hypothetical protein
MISDGIPSNRCLSTVVGDLAGIRIDLAAAKTLSTQTTAAGPVDPAPHPAEVGSDEGPKRPRDGNRRFCSSTVNCCPRSLKLQARTTRIR